MEATIQQIEAQKAQAEAQLENAQAAYTRSQQLFKDGVVSKADLDAARATARSADASVRAATAQINATRENASASNFNVKGAEATEREASTNLSKTLIYAPVNGIVSKLNVERGERVVGTAQMAGTEMMRISNFSSLEVRVDVSENDILRIALGNEADISVDAYLDRKFKGKVTEIAFSSKESATAAATSTDQVTNFVVRVRIDAASYADLMARGKSPFLPGMSAQVDVKTKSVVGALAIPVQSVTTRDLEAKKDAKPSDEDGIKVKDKKDQTDASAKKRVTEVVFVAIGDSVAKRAVTTGIQDDKYIQILTGLQEGDEVVSGPYSTVSRKLKSGMKISKNTAKKDTK